MASIYTAIHGAAWQRTHISIQLHVQLQIVLYVQFIIMTNIICESDLRRVNFGNGA